MEKEVEESREKFLRIYPDIPKALRKEIVVTIEGEPYTWNTSYFEIKNKTLLGKVILKRLEDMGLI